MDDNDDKFSIMFAETQANRVRASAGNKQQFKNRQRLDQKFMATAEHKLGLLHDVIGLYEAAIDAVTTEEGVDGIYLAWLNECIVEDPKRFRAEAITNLKMELGELRQQERALAKLAPFNQRLTHLSSQEIEDLFAINQRHYKTQEWNDDFEKYVEVKNDELSLFARALKLETEHFGVPTNDPDPDVVVVPDEDGVEPGHTIDDTEIGGNLPAEIAATLQKYSKVTLDELYIREQMLSAQAREARGRPSSFTPPPGPPEKQGAPNNFTAKEQERLQEAKRAKMHIAK